MGANVFACGIPNRCKIEIAESISYTGGQARVVLGGIPGRVTIGDGSIGVMSSSTTLVPPPAAAEPSHHTLRLRLKPKGSVAGYVDGAWWPRSRDLAAELPALLAVLAIRPGTIERVTYNLTTWTSVPRRLLIEGSAVRMEGFRSQPPCTVTVAGQGRQRLTLLILPPDAPEATAHETLMRAARRDNADSPDTLLAPRRAAGGEFSDGATERWEVDGGRVR
ncbi:MULTISPECIES: DUF5994 family protein [Amycolatopsis]|uniref:DUF5994 family protein n=1 Tax=Amycolatopsis TaxID=1813 RepID=UPI001EF02142|nr:MULTISPECIES: DUF5994 family protein [Amycolatopsis]MCF6425500.1 DUF5994 family protein [Amycolatopsis tucumanensis]